MATMTGINDSAVARCPPEIWLKILRHTGQHFPHSNVSWGAVVTTFEIFQSWYRGRDIPWNEGWEIQDDWSLRLVCKAWNALLRPILFKSLWITGFPVQLQRAIALLQTGTGDHPAGQLVRSLTIRFFGLTLDDAIADMRMMQDGTPMSTLARKVLDLCPHIDTLICYSSDAFVVDCLPSSTSRIKKLFLQWVGPPGNTFPLLLTALPAVEVLDLGNSVFLPKFGEPPLDPKHAMAMPALHSLSICLDPSNSSLLHVLSSFQLPCLRYLLLTNETTQMETAGLAAFLRIHGPSLRGIIVSHALSTWEYDEELALLSLCPNLEEYVTCIPSHDWQSGFPALPRLGEIGILGIRLTQRQGPQPLPRTLADWRNKEELQALSFVTKLSEANLPSLRVVKALDRQVMTFPGWETAWTEFQERTARLFKPRGIRFEDAGRV